MMSPAEVAGVLGVNARTVRRLIAEGSIPGVRVGRVYRIDPGDLQQFIAAGGTIGHDRQPAALGAGADSGRDPAGTHD